MSVETMRDESEVPSGIQHVHRALESPLPTPARRALTFGLIISALRCTVQYVLLPFVVPWIGVAASIPPWVVLGLCGLALVSLARNVRYLWRLHHTRRWSYLAVAGVVATALSIFIVMDLRGLLGL